MISELCWGLDDRCHYATKANVNKMQAHSPKLPTTRAELWRESEKGCKLKVLLGEQVLSEQLCLQ